jgi:phosphopantetheinyl transferase
MIAETDVWLWVVETEGVSENTERGWARFLAADERARAESIASSDVRRSYVAAHALVRSAVGAVFGMPAAEVVFPSVSRGASLTHTSGLAACALAGSPLRVGVDAELLGRRVSQALLAWSGVARPADFLFAWTAKEACLKAGGRGIGGTPLREILAIDRDPGWRVTSFVTAQHAISVAVPATDPIRLHAWFCDPAALPSLVRVAEMSSCDAG